MADNKFQSWNSRSKKFCLFENGRIKDMQAEKYAGVPVKKDKPEAQEPEQFTDESATPAGKPENPTQSPAAAKPGGDSFPWMDWFN